MVKWTFVLGCKSTIFFTIATNFMTIKLFQWFLNFRVLFFVLGIFLD